MKKKFLLIVFLIFSFVTPMFSQERSAEEELPQSLIDLRRFEIITLGAMPFVTLDVTIGYSMGKFIDERAFKGNTNYAFPNPLKSSSSYSTDEMKGIILASFAICLGIGAADLIKNIIKRKNIENQTKKNNINISKIENDPDATKIQMKNSTEENNKD